MADYCTVQDVKDLAGASEATDDTLIATLITRASAIVDAHTRRSFTATTSTRYYSVDENVYGDTLYLDSDLPRVVAITNGDGSEVTSDNLLPLNSPPYRRVRVGGDSSWEASDDGIRDISVQGEWGYCTDSNRPADITQATARLALWLYRQREAPFSRVGNTLTGEYEVPVAIPADVKAILDRYRAPGGAWGVA